MKEDNITPEQLRIKALELYNRDWKISEICSTLNCSRNWFYKWLRRYNANVPNWYKEQSRAPKTTSKKTSYEMERLILEERKRLISKPYLQYGPQAIYYALAQKGINSPPIC